MENSLGIRRRSEDVFKILGKPLEILRTKRPPTFYVPGTPHRSPTRLSAEGAMMRRECHPLDGVPVKITLRPPKAITVPSHFLKTDLPASLEHDYDFSLEYRVLQDVQAERERQAKLEALRPTTAVPIKEFTTLTPSQPSSSASPEETSPPTPSTNISITEFEPEAFSPFDQVELQTINDLEELHSIFGGVKISESDLKTNPKVDPLKITSDISSMRNLFDDEQLKRIGQTHSSAPSGSPYHFQSLNGTQVTVPAVSLPQIDPFKDLSKNLQTMAREISAMGFPPQRVALAVMDLGEDKGKVVDHLCLLEKLVDEGFEESDASQALQFMSHNLEKSRDFLKSMTQLADLGFPKGDIAVALKLHNSDRDKALDELLKG